jgi:hypothetical protein
MLGFSFLWSPKDSSHGMETNFGEKDHYLFQNEYEERFIKNFNYMELFKHMGMEEEAEESLYSESRGPHDSMMSGKEPANQSSQYKQSVKE